jgi:hypothetical protein
MFVCVYSVFVYVAALRRADTCPRSPTDCTNLRNRSETKRFTDALCSKVGAAGEGERDQTVG